MSDLLLQAIHRIPEGSVILIRSTNTSAYDGGFLNNLHAWIAEKVGHDQFVVVLLDSEDTWQVQSARAVYEQLGRFLAKVDGAGPDPS